MDDPPAATSRPWGSAARQYPHTSGACATGRDRRALDFDSAVLLMTTIAPLDAQRARLLMEDLPRSGGGLATRRVFPQLQSVFMANRGGSVAAPFACSTWGVPLVLPPRGHDGRARFHWSADRSCGLSAHSPERWLSGRRMKEVEELPAADLSRLPVEYRTAFPSGRASRPASGRPGRAGRRVGAARARRLGARTLLALTARGPGRAGGDGRVRRAVRAPRGKPPAARPGLQPGSDGRGCRRRDGGVLLPGRGGGHPAHRGHLPHPEDPRCCRC